MDVVNESPPRPSKARTHMIRVRVSAEEYAALSAKAETAGMTVSAFLRDHAGTVFIRNRDDEKRRHGLLNRINANLNMISKWVNTYKSTADAVRVMVHLVDVRREIDQLLHRWDAQS